MDKSFMVYIAIGIGFIYVITKYVGGIQKEDEVYRNDGYNEEMKYEKYKGHDSIGQDILDLSGADARTQFEAWNKSPLKQEFLHLFPKFELMKEFVNERIRGQVLQSKLMSTLNDMEDQFLSGSISAEAAKRTLGNLK